MYSTTGDIEENDNIIGVVSQCQYSGPFTFKL